MDIQYRLHNFQLIISLPKEVDHTCADQIRQETDYIMEEYLIKQIVFDFKDTIFMDSSGIGMIMGRYRAMGMRKDCVKAICVNRRIDRIIQLAGLHSYIEIRQGEVQESQHE